MRVYTLAQPSQAARREVRAEPGLERGPDPEVHHGGREAREDPHHDEGDAVRWKANSTLKKWV